MPDPDDELELDDTNLEPDDAEEDEIDDVEEVDEGEGQDREDRGEEDPSGEDEGQEGRQDQVGRQSRGQGRIARLAAETADLRRRLEESDRARQTAERAAQDRQRQEGAAQRDARLAEMMPDERAAYLIEENNRNTQQQLAAMDFRMQDSADRTAFDGLCARNPTAAKLRDDVEARLADMRRSGTTAPRETVLRYLIGDRALKSAPKAKAKQQRAADGERQRQQAKPGAARSDVGSGGGRRGSEQDARRKRLADVQI